MRAWPCSLAVLALQHLAQLLQQDRSQVLCLTTLQQQLLLVPQVVLVFQGRRSSCSSRALSSCLTMQLSSRSSMRSLSTILEVQPGIDWTLLQGYSCRHLALEEVTLQLHGAAGRCCH